MAAGAARGEAPGKARAGGRGRLTAVLDVGSSSFRLMIVDRRPGGAWQVVDRAVKPVPLGRDVFSSGRIGRVTLTRGLQVLGGFCELLAGWNIAPADTLVIGTSALREARNGDTFVDRVALRTGLRVDVVGEVEESQLTYLAVRHAVSAELPALLRATALIVEVGGGHTTLILVKRGRISALRTLKVGTVRMGRPLQLASGADAPPRQIVEESLRPTLATVQKDLQLARVGTFIAIGSDVSLPAEAVRAGQHAEHSGGSQIARLSRADFDRFIEESIAKPAADVVRDLQISYSDAELLAPGLLMYRSFLELTAAAEMIVARVSIREGVLLRHGAAPSAREPGELRAQVTANAISLGRRYRFDERHARQVARLTCRLFDALQQEHGLDAACRLLLEVSAILHDIGMVIRASGHHKHGHYIVNNSEIFGLDGRDRAIVANVVRYHRRALPSPSHGSYVNLARGDRIVVNKLAALLRVADALDRSHQARVGELQVEKSDDEVTIRCRCSGSLALKRLALERKADLFQEVFGLRVRLERLAP